MGRLGPGPPAPSSSVLAGPRRLSGRTAAASPGGTGLSVTNDAATVARADSERRLPRQPRPPGPPAPSSLDFGLAAAAESFSATRRDRAGAARVATPLRSSAVARPRRRRSRAKLAAPPGAWAAGPALSSMLRLRRLGPRPPALSSVRRCSRLSNDLPQCPHTYHTIVSLLPCSQGHTIGEHGAGKQLAPPIARAPTVQGLPSEPRLSSMQGLSNCRGSRACRGSRSFASALDSQALSSTAHTPNTPQSHSSHVLEDTQPGTRAMQVPYPGSSAIVDPSPLSSPKRCEAQFTSYTLHVWNRCGCKRVNFQKSHI
jgi:hypothetical protein